MSNTIIVFISGITGVFVGMSLLYIAIRITSFVTDKIEMAREGKK